MTKIWGAMLIILGSGAVGFQLCKSHRRKEQLLESLLKALQWMQLELNYRMPPLSSLCMDASKQVKGDVQEVLQNLSRELEQQVTSDVSACMDVVLRKIPTMPQMVWQHFEALGRSLGSFDLQGQLEGLDCIICQCKADLHQLKNGRETRIRNYQAVSLCVGAAVVLLLL